MTSDPTEPRAPADAMIEAARTSARAFGDGEAAPRVDGYRLGAVLGRGGQGVVYRAEHLATSRTVAVKVGPVAGGFADPAARERFRREVRALAQLQHPNLVAVFDHGVMACGRPFFVMDRVQGERVDAWAVGCGRYPRALAAVFARIADAVHRAHQHGVVHRDLKPGNLLVCADGEPRVLDFGLALLAEPAPRSEAGHRGASDETVDTVDDGFVGSVPWTSPEQAAPGGRAGTHSDVYSLGVVLFDALTGALPYPTTGSLDQVLAAIRTEPPCDVREARPELDAEIAAIVARCLHKEPDRRYESAAALAADLRRYLQGEPLQALAGRRGYRLRKLLQRHRAAVGAVALAAAALVAGLLLALRSWRDAENERQRLARSNYANQVLLAAHAIDDDNVGRARELLAACPPELRDWEWRRLRWQTDRSAFASPPRGRIGHVAADAAGTWVAAGDLDGDVVLADARTGTERARWSAGGAAISALAFAADGTQLVTGDERGALSVWTLEPEGGGIAVERRQQVELGSPLHGLALHPGGDLAAVGLGGDAVAIVSLRTATVVARRSFPGQTTGRDRGLAWTPDGGQLAVGVHGRIELCDEALQSVRSFAVRDDPASLAFLGDGSRLVVGTGLGDLLLLDRDGGELAHRAPHGNWIYQVGVRADDLVLLSAGSDHTVKLWDAETLALRTTLRGHAGRVFSAAFVGPLGRIVSGSEDGTFRLWSRDTEGSARVFAGHRGQIWALRWSPDGRSVATAGADGTLRLWNADDAAVQPWIARGAEHRHAVAWSPDGATVAVGDGAGRVAVHPAAGGPPILEVDATGRRSAGLAFLPDGRLLAASTGGDVASIDMATGDVERRRGVRPGVLSMAPSPDGALLALGHVGGRVTVLRVDDGVVVRELAAHERSVFDVAWDPRGERLASASTDATAKVWRVDTFACTAVLRGHRNGVRAVAFHPDGSRLATGGWDDTIRVWDAETGELVLTIRGHAERVEGLAFDPSGRRLATVSLDATLRIWDSAPPAGDAGSPDRIPDRIPDRTADEPDPEHGEPR